MSSSKELEQLRGDERLVELARKKAPLLAEEYEIARAEMEAIAKAFAKSFAGSEKEALHWARGVAANMVRVSRRWAIARQRIVACLGQ